MPSKIVVFFNQAQNGWTETYYTSASQGGINPYNAPFLQWMQARYAILAPPGRIYGFRVSSITLPKQSQIWLFQDDYQQGLGQAGGNTLPPDYVSVDLLVQVIGVTGKMRHIWIRGLPVAYVSRDVYGTFVLSPAASSAVAKVFNAMYKCNLSIRYLIPPGSAGVVQYPIFSVGPTPGMPNNTQLTTTALTSFPLSGSNEALFTGIPHDDLPGFPRITLGWNPTTTAGVGTINIPYRYRASVALYNPQKLKMQNLLYGLDGFNDLSVQGVTEHKTGRPFGSGRGRSRVLVRAQ